MPITINTAAPRRSPDAPAKKSAGKLLLRVFEGVVLLLAVAFGLMIRWGVYETAIVTSGSMQPTVDIGDRLVIDHRKSLHGRWRRGDILLFDTPVTWEGEAELLVKRLIGLPGETVEVRQGAVFVNGKPLKETYIRATPDEQSYLRVLKPGEYYVLGDNRGTSNDSRDNGPITERDIRGRAVWRLTPVNGFGGLASPAY